MWFCCLVHLWAFSYMQPQLKPASCYCVVSSGVTKMRPAYVTCSCHWHWSHLSACALTDALHTYTVQIHEEAGFHVWENKAVLMNEIWAFLLSEWMRKWNWVSEIVHEGRSQREARLVVVRFIESVTPVTDSRFKITQSFPHLRLNKLNPLWSLSLSPYVFNSLQTLTYDTPAAGSISTSAVFLKVANQTWPCPTNISYYPDPEFTSFVAAAAGRSVQVILQVKFLLHSTHATMWHRCTSVFLLLFQKKPDKLGVTAEELSVRGVQETKEYSCNMERKESTEKMDFFICTIPGLRNPQIDHLLVNLSFKQGSTVVFVLPRCVVLSSHFRH